MTRYAFLLSTRNVAPLSLLVVTDPQARCYWETQLFGLLDVTVIIIFFFFSILISDDPACL